MTKGQAQLGVLGNKVDKVTIIEIQTGKEIAVITNDLITTADGFAVKLTPIYD